ncbi:hypothetical protein BGW41_004940 [Actinomortierella wolfii]|nr:hypothetical protein BGW41_004940 [Actinomortierella wolfii]
MPGLTFDSSFSLVGFAQQGLLTLFVKGFPMITHQELKEISQKVGAIALRGMGPENAKHAAFMDFKDNSTAGRAIEVLGAWSFPSSPSTRLKVEYAKQSGPRTSAPTPHAPAKPPTSIPPVTMASSHDTTSMYYQQSYATPGYAYYSSWGHSPWASYYGAPTTASLVPTQPPVSTVAPLTAMANEPVASTIAAATTSTAADAVMTGLDQGKDEYLETLLAVRPYRKEAQRALAHMVRAIKENHKLMEYVVQRMLELQLPDPFVTAAVVKDEPPLSSLEMAVYLSDPLNYRPPPPKSSTTQTTHSTFDMAATGATPAPQIPTIANNAQPQANGGEATTVVATTRWKDKPPNESAKPSNGALAEEEKLAQGNHGGSIQRQQLPLRKRKNEESAALLSSDESEIESEPEQGSNSGVPKRRRLTREEAEELVCQQEKHEQQRKRKQQQKQNRKQQATPPIAKTSTTRPPLKTTGSSLAVLSPSPENTNPSSASIPNELLQNVSQNRDKDKQGQQQQQNKPNIEVQKRPIEKQKSKKQHDQQQAIHANKENQVQHQYVQQQQLPQNQMTGQASDVAITENHKATSSGAQAHQSTQANDKELGLKAENAPVLEVSSASTSNASSSPVATAISLNDATTGQAETSVDNTKGPKRSKLSKKKREALKRRAELVRLQNADLGVNPTESSDEANSAPARLKSRFSGEHETIADSDVNAALVSQQEPITAENKRFNEPSGTKISKSSIDSQQPSQLLQQPSSDRHDEGVREEDHQTTPSTAPNVHGSSQASLTTAEQDEADGHGESREAAKMTKDKTHDSTSFGEEDEDRCMQGSNVDNHPEKGSKASCEGQPNKMTSSMRKRLAKKRRMERIEALSESKSKDRNSSNGNEADMNHKHSVEDSTSTAAMDNTTPKLET